MCRCRKSRFYAASRFLGPEGSSSSQTQNAFSSAFMHGKEGVKRHLAIKLALRSFMLQSQLVSNHRDEF
ncbi:hypothetical protein CWD84_09675 [Bacillus siamensis]|uniref:Uncharacterized protein n=1 Tax=Bacillus siamensis TaxID=659243 RepID=A0AAI8N027_9BACI|nr:hypothetical protein CWD84_09675 [Bacillus siamensis]